VINGYPPMPIQKDRTMKKLMLMLAMTLALAGCIFKTDIEKGITAYENKEYATALNLFPDRADDGDPEAGDVYAQNNLGVMYAKGEGVIEDDKEAASWFRKAADQGFAPAQFNLGNIYRRGEGVLQDDKEAVKWYRMAADQNFDDAQLNLGNMYLSGEGVLQDDKKAYMWWNVARANDDDKADHNIKSIIQRMTPADIATAEDMARQCLASNYRDC
jgi:TPR repeat protein